LKILLLGGGSEQLIAISEAKKIGYQTIVCDGSKDAPGLKIGDIGICTDIRNKEKILEIAREHNIKGIFCHAVEIPEVVAFVAKELNLPGLNLEAAENATKKDKRIEILAKNGVKVAKHFPIYDRKKLIEVSKKLGFPLILKPTDNAGSRGVRLVSDHNDLINAYEEAIKFSFGKGILIEEVLKGQQISTESIIYDGKIFNFAFADRNYSESDFFYPYFIENGINFPSSCSSKLEKEVWQLVEKTIKILGINFGSAKGDIIIHDEKPYIIEMAARSSGGWFGAGSIPIATGVNPMNFLLKISMGQEPDFNTLKPNKKLACAQRYWIPKNNFRIKSVEGLDKVHNLPGVKFFNSWFPSEGTMLKKATNHSERYAQVICTAETRLEAIKRADYAINSIQIKTL